MLLHTLASLLLSWVLQKHAPTVQDHMASGWSVSGLVELHLSFAFCVCQDNRVWILQGQGLQAEFRGLQAGFRGLWSVGLSGVRVSGPRRRACIVGTPHPDLEYSAEHTPYVFNRVGVSQPSSSRLHT